MKEVPLRSNNDNAVEPQKFPTKSKDSVKAKTEDKVKDSEMEKVPVAKKTSSPTPERISPEKESVGALTPSNPIRSRPNAESHSAVKRDSADLEVIKLPSVKQLAQQFNVKS